MGNRGGLPADAIPWQGQPYSILLTLPPLAVVYFKLGKPPDGGLIQYVDGYAGNQRDWPRW